MVLIFDKLLNFKESFLGPPNILDHAENIYCTVVILYLHLYDVTIDVNVNHCSTMLIKLFNYRCFTLIFNERK